jgi:hypothetical protein
MRFGELIKNNIFTITPLTFIIDCKDELCEANFNAFLRVYEDYIPIDMRIKKSTGEIRRNLK